ncbi:MAG TPA: TonB-dependent receptor [Puia sp.]|jgi:outer membrane receptor protein involved in Fe transport
MRIATYMMIITLGGMAATGYAQNISYTGKNISLQHFFSVITSQTGFTVFYNNEVISQSHPVSLNLQNATLQNALDAALNKQLLTYNVQGRTIFISVKKSGTPSGADKESSKFVRGNVTDSLKNPIANASVTIKNSTRSVITGEDGNFTIPVKNEDSFLLITCIGYENKEEKISSAILNVQMSANVNPLEQVIIGGNIAAIKRKAETTSLTVINSKTLDALPVNDLSLIFRGMVPGTNSFSPGDDPEGATTLSIRGTGGTFPYSQIAVYVDGVEYAGGSGYLASLNKENIDRVEVLRGPASSTLYGTGSNGGIIQVYTKQGIPGQSSLNFTASAGFLRSKWVQSDPYQQFYNLQSVTGLKKVSVTLGGTFMSNGAYLPEGGSKSEAMYAGVKWNPSVKLTANVTARYEHTGRHISRDPSFDTATHPNASALASNFGPALSPHIDVDDESYLIGVNLSHRTTAHWTNNLTAGYTQNNYNEIPMTNDSGNIPLRRFYFIISNKVTTVRYFNEIQTNDQGNDGFNFHFMSGLEYKKYFYQEAFVTATNPQNFSGDPPNENYGVFAQANPSYKNIFLTMALRYDHNRLFENDGSFNPRMGITTNFNIQRSLIVKPRISWGSGITAPTYTYRYGDPSQGIAANPDLQPQNQRGFEYGMEFFSTKNKFNFEVVYYDNHLKNMFVLNNIPPIGSTSQQQYINVGDVANTGWELSASYKPNNHFSLHGTFSAMSSVIKDSSGEQNSIDLSGMPPGTQIRRLPRHTAGLFMTYLFSSMPVLKGHGDISFNITEVDGIIDLDKSSFEEDLAYGRVSSSTPNYADPYWKKTGVVIQLGLNVDYYISDQLRFFIQGSNIANNNIFESSSSYLTYGASWMFGIKYNITR